MSSHQVIIVKEAQSLKKLEDLILYLKNHCSPQYLCSTINTKQSIREQSFTRPWRPMVLYFESPEIRDYQVPAWIERYLMTKGIKTDPSASAMLTEYLGTDLHKIVNELDKLIITLPEAKPVITTTLIEKNIGISKDYNNFELQKAIGERNILKQI